MTDPEIRESAAGDRAAIEALYPRAFPDEDLLPLLRALLDDEAVLSLVAMDGATFCGHAAFTRCGLTEGDETLALLGPVAVDPERQGNALGGALIRAGLDRMAKQGIARVLVLGDPAYYGRFGFRPERGIAPPYRLPEAWRDAWQSLAPGAADPRPTGTLVVPACWRDPALWSD